MIAPLHCSLMIAGLVLSALISHVSADEAITNSQTIQAKLSVASENLNAAQKQVSLKQAAVDVTRSRIAELESQLQTFRKRITQDSEKLQAAEKTAAQTAAHVQELAADLKRHQHADQLVAAATKRKTELAAEKKRRQELLSAEAKVTAQIAHEESRHNVAVAEIQTIREELPQVRSQLTDARSEYDALQIGVDEVQWLVQEAEQHLTSQQQLLSPKRKNHQRAQAAAAQLAAGIASLRQSANILQTAAEKVKAADDLTTTEAFAALDDVITLQQHSQQLIKLTSRELHEAQDDVDAAQSAFVVVKNELDDVQRQLAEQERKHFRLQLAVAELRTAERSQQIVAKDSTKQAEQRSQQRQQIIDQLAKANVSIEQLGAEYRHRQQMAEAALEPLGRFVSFSRHVAPIFAKHCLACHNADTSGGHLNMASFATLAQGGKSGLPFYTRDTSRSVLLKSIEGGHMPKNADPLNSDDVATIRKWIQLGARLDAGTMATAALFEVMPELPQPLPPKTYRVPIPVTATALNADGSLLASSGYHEVLVWNTADGTLLRRLSNVAERVYDLEFTADSQHLIVAAGTLGQLGEVKVFSTADGTHKNTLVRTRDAMFALAISPDGQQVAAAGAEGHVHVVAVPSGQPLLNSKTHTDWILDINWSVSGNQLVTASRDKTAKLISAADAQVLHTFTAHDEPLAAAVFTPDGKSIASAGSDGKIHIWNTANAKESRSIQVLGGDIFRLTVTAENRLLSASADRNVREHQLSDGKLLQTFAGHNDWVNALSYCSSKQLIASGSYDGEIRVWNAEDGTIETSFIAIPNATPSATVAAARQ